jgi:prepilin-type N-terminal cleavage/methylation domain-containing protein
MELPDKHVEPGILMKNRNGFSLVEVVVALVILAFAVMGAQSLTATMINTVATANIENSAAQLVEDRIDLIRTDPAYDSLTTKYAGTESTIPGWSTLQRVTQLARTRDSTAAGITDFYTVTVTVNGTGLRAPLRRTIVVGSP